MHTAYLDGKLFSLAKVTKSYYSPW